MEPRASDTFNGLFDGKTRLQIKRSIRAHRGALTKIFRYINTACNAVTVLPTSKGAREIETLRLKMEEKIEEIEAGYDTLIEMGRRQATLGYSGNVFPLPVNGPHPLGRHFIVDVGQWYRKEVSTHCHQFGEQVPRTINFGLRNARNLPAT